MKKDIVRRVREYLERWTQEDIDRLQKEEKHGNEEHLRFAVIMLLDSSRKLEDSSRKLEKLTWALAFCSVALIVLTLVLIYRTYVT